MCVLMTQRRTRERDGSLTDEQLLELVARYNAGEPVATLATEAGYTWAGMHAALKRYGVKFRGRRGPSPRRITTSDPRVIEAFTLHDAGMGYVQASEQVGLASITLRHLLVETGRDPQRYWRGSGAKNWKGGRQRAGEYVRIPVDELTESMGSGGYVLEHRAVMAHHLDRTLLSEETVHHKNGKCDDNRLSNLELWSSRHPKGQRVEDLREFAKEILALYPDTRRS